MKNAGIYLILCNEMKAEKNIKPRVWRVPNPNTSPDVQKLHEITHSIFAHSLQPFKTAIHGNIQTIKWPFSGAELINLKSSKSE